MGTFLYNRSVIVGVCRSTSSYSRCALSSPWRSYSFFRYFCLLPSRIWVSGRDNADSLRYNRTRAVLENATSRRCVRWKDRCMYPLRCRMLLGVVSLSPFLDDLQVSASSSDEVAIAVHVFCCMLVKVLTKPCTDQLDNDSGISPYPRWLWIC